MTTTRLRGGLLALGLLLAACGSGTSGGGGGEADKSPAQILADAVGALKTATSFHISGRSAAAGSDAITIDADVATGGSSQGTIGMSGATAKFVVTAGKFYVQGRDFWNKVAGPQAAAVVGDSWVILPGGSDTATFQRFVDPATIASCLSLDHGTLSKGGTSTVDGQSAVVIVDKGDKPGTAPGKLYVATGSPTYPLRFEITGSITPGTPPGGDQCGSSTTGGSNSDQGTITLSQFNAKSVSATPPPNPIDLQSLLSGGTGG